MPFIAKYRIIYEAIRAEIAGGLLAPGAALPSEHTLAARWEVSHPTVRKAIAMLQADGLVARSQGRKTTVKGTPRGIGILSLSGTTSALGKTLKTEVIVAPHHREWDEAFGFQLTPAERAAGCVYFERLRVVDDQPVMFDVTMLPDIHLGGFCDIDLRDRSLFEVLRSAYRVGVAGGRQQIFAGLADRHLQQHLHVRPGSPVLQLDRRIDTTREGFHIYSRVCCVTGKYGLSGTF
jgi:DNA-binding GntR family transcriptional regulator